MPRQDGVPPGTLSLLILRVLSAESLHGYAISRRIAERSDGGLNVEEGSLYPALQKLLVKGWIEATPAISATGRQIREYRLTPRGRQQLDAERAVYDRRARAIAAVLKPT
jgi:PadR family transcriptional regulator PadR